METTTQYWDCECKEDYIRPREMDVCPICWAYREDQPDSRVNEVEEAGLPISKLTEEEYNELDDLYAHYYSDDYLLSRGDYARMIILENKASEEEVRGLLENYGTSPIKSFVKESKMDKKLLNKFAKIIKDIDSAMWGVTSGTIEDISLRSARADLIDIVFKNGYVLSDTYRLVKDNDISKY